MQQAVTKIRLQALADEIRECIKNTGLDLLRAGQRLIEARAILDGGFGTWVEDELGFTLRTAENFMRIAHRFQERPEIISLLPATVLYSLASESVSDRVIDVVASKAQQGERMKVREVKALIAGSQPAKPHANGHKTVAEHVAAATRAVTEEIQTTGAVSVDGEAQPVTPTTVAQAITEHAAEGVKSDGEVLRQKLEREQGLGEPAVRSRAIVDYVSPDGRVTFMSMEMAQKLRAHQRVYCIVYVQEGI